MKLNDILNLYELIKDIHIKEISSSEDKYRLLKIFGILKDYNESFNKFKEDAQNKIVSNKEEFEDKLKKSKEDEEAKKYVENINSELTSLMIKELTSEKEFNIEKISKDSLIQLSSNNDFTLEQLNYIKHYIVEQ